MSDVDTILHSIIYSFIHTFIHTFRPLEPILSFIMHRSRDICIQKFKVIFVMFISNFFFDSYPLDGQHPATTPLEDHLRPDLGSLSGSDQPDQPSRTGTDQPENVLDGVSIITVRKIPKKLYIFIYQLTKLYSVIKQVRIHESTVACDWAGAVMPEKL